MKTLLSVLTVLGLMGAVTFTQPAHAKESTTESMNATKNKVKRSVKKGTHRVEEAVCAEGDAKCLAKKAKHRVEEGSDYVKDKATETKDKMDSDSKAGE